MTLNESRNELRSIINELRDIEWGFDIIFRVLGSSCAVIVLIK